MRNNRNSTSFQTHAATSRAFTLIELMVAIFLLLIVMVGVNQVFTTTGQTVGSNQALSDLSRTARATQATLSKDFASVAGDGATFIIRSEQAYQYQDKADYLSDSTNTVPYTADFTSSGTESSVAAYNYGTRSHRKDRISFFTRQLLHRQTGNDGTLVANQSTMEQWVWYGHLRLPDNTTSPAPANFYDPGDRNNSNVQMTPVTNPNNFFANQWQLGRVGMLLVEATGAPPSVIDSSGITENGIMSAADTANVAADAAQNTLCAPLSMNASNGTRAWFLDQSRYDLVGTSIQDFTSQLSTLLNNAAYTNYNFWQEMMCGRAVEVTNTNNQRAAAVLPAGSRFQAIPFITRPLTAEYAARTTPILAPGVSQFIVEFAGDFVSQADAGNTTGLIQGAVAPDGAVGYLPNGTLITSSATDGGAYFNATTPSTLNPSGQDGKIDFNVSGTGASAVRSIRWYGMPRSTSGNTTISVANGDVCPLRDTIRLANGYSTLQAPVEKSDDANSKDANTQNVLDGTPPWGTGAANMGTPNPNPVLAPPYYYTLAWGPKDTVRPKLIRIIMTLEDPNGRLASGQTYEYVFPLQ